jgi:hypothetical protein
MSSPTVATGSTTLGGVTVTRYRCRACGNRTRFDVTATRRTTRFHHYTLGGELEIEDEQLLSEVVESVSCRWCGNGASVEVEDDDEAVELGAVEIGAVEIGERGS